MPQFSAHLSMLYPELPFLERFEAAARDGFRAVECLFPYAHPAAELRARLRGNGLQLVLFNAPPAGTEVAEIDALWRSGACGTACLAGREQEFRAGMERALRTAEALDCPRIHCMAGAPAIGAGRTARAVYLRNLEWAAARAAGAGRAILIEPINTRAMPGYFLNRQAEAHAIVEEVGAPNLQVLMDLYHCQIMEGDVSHKIRGYLSTGRVGHFQIAGVPDRHEPDEGELDYGHVLGVLDRVAAECGWNGWVGCEYRPRLGGVPGGTSRGLAWRARLAGSGQAPALS